MENNSQNQSDEENETDQTDEQVNGIAVVPPAEEGEQLKSLLARLGDSDKNNEAILFNRFQSDYTTILNARTKNIYAPAFLPLPLESFSWKNVGTIRWQDVVKYLFY